MVATDYGFEILISTHKNNAVHIRSIQSSSLYSSIFGLFCVLLRVSHPLISFLPSLQNLPHLPRYYLLASIHPSIILSIYISTYTTYLSTYPFTLPIYLPTYNIYLLHTYLFTSPTYLTTYFFNHLHNLHHLRTYTTYTTHPPIHLP